MRGEILHKGTTVKGLFIYAKDLFKDERGTVYMRVKVRLRTRGLRLTSRFRWVKWKELELYVDKGMIYPC